MMVMIFDDDDDDDSDDDGDDDAFSPVGQISNSAPGRGVFAPEFPEKPPNRGGRFRSENFVANSVLAVMNF